MDAEGLPKKWQDGWMMQAAFSVPDALTSSFNQNMSRSPFRTCKWIDQLARQARDQDSPRGVQTTLAFQELTVGKNRTGP